MKLKPRKSHIWDQLQDLLQYAYTAAIFLQKQKDSWQITAVTVATEHPILSCPPVLCYIYY
jgi:hypothetical protein